MANGVEFEEDSFGTKRAGVPAGFGVGGYQAPRQTGGIAGWLIRHHIAKSPEGAQKILLVVVIFNIVVTFIVVKYFL